MKENEGGTRSRERREEEYRVMKVGEISAIVNENKGGTRSREGREGGQL